MQLRKPARSDHGRVVLTIRDRAGRGLKSESKTVYDSTPQELMTEFQRWLLDRVEKPVRRRAQPA